MEKEKTAKAVMSVFNTSLERKADFNAMDGVFSGKCKQVILKKSIFY